MEALLKNISNALAGFACVILVLVMLTTFADVLGRYFFNAPVTFAVEMIQLGMGLLVLLGLAITTLERGHIAVDIADTLAPPRVRRMFALFASLCGAAFISLIAWRLWDRAMNFRRDGLATDVLFVQIWPVVALMAIAAAMAAAVAIAQLFIPALTKKTPEFDVDMEV
ncbi:TRAP transporter small permease [uncultured Sulfitobacter sp.]|uniref:TRAP transporter small permease n=1 Tax=uncultured Sulfitobacter sp. TaxID=191468 RepID=UPI002621BBDE|nr:TRAP transporter small permease [uncultured Sulfitobacter sp.]